MDRIQMLEGLSIWAGPNRKSTGYVKHTPPKAKPVRGSYVKHDATLRGVDGFGGISTTTAVAVGLGALALIGGAVIIRRRRNNRR